MLDTPVSAFINKYERYAIATWSPDGKALAVARDQYGGRYGSRLYVVNADGSGLSTVPGIRTAVAPAWRPEWLGSREHIGPRG